MKISFEYIWWLDLTISVGVSVRVSVGVSADVSVGVSVGHFADLPWVFTWTCPRELPWACP